jgi:hypothetical protein
MWRACTKNVCKNEDVNIPVSNLVTNILVYEILYLKFVIAYLDFKTKTITPKN